MRLGDWVRARFSAPPARFDEPRSARFSIPYVPVDSLIEGIYQGIGRVGREQALGVPAVLRGRNMICSVATLPLQAVDEDNRIEKHPLLRQIDPNVANAVTIAQTVEDLLFEAVAWWRITAFGADLRPYSAVRYAPGDVSMTPPTNYRHGYLPSGLPTEASTHREMGKVVWMGGEPVSVSDVIRFDSPNPAFLVAGQRAVKRAIALDKAADLYAANPRRRGYFSSESGPDPEQDQIDEFLNRIQEAARRNLDGWAPSGTEYKSIQDPTPAELQIIAQQQRADLAIANALGIDPEDLGINTTSRTYQNATDRRKDRINDVLAPYMVAITGRLSMPDVTKRGVRVKFDLDDYLKPDPKTRAEVDEIRIRTGVKDAVETRKAEGLPPRAITTSVKRTLSPTPQEAELHAEPVTFAHESLAFDYEPEAAFAVDTEARTITGLAVPWGKTAKSNGKRYRFARGAVKWSAVNRVKLLRDHVNSSAIGKAIRFEETDQGLVATFKVSAGRAGDEALALAADEVLDGLSIGVDFRPEHVRPDPQNPGAYLVSSAALREVSLTAVPAFDDSRLTSVTASREETGMPEDTTETVPAEQPVTFSAEQFGQFMERLTPQPPEERPVVDPTRTPVQVTREATPYAVRRTFNRITGDETFVFSNDQEHDFTADLANMARNGDAEGLHTDAGKRVMGLLRATFAEVTTGDVNELNPEIQRPDMYVDQRDYRTPIMDLISRGGPPQGVNPFRFPKFASAAGLVGNHTEGTEPASGSFVTTSQLIEPTALSGKASITREVWDMGGNPAVSGLIFSQMVRAYREGLETAAATFLNTLTAATDITISAAAADETLASEIEGAMAALQFTRGYDFSAFVMEQGLYTAVAGARDESGRPMYPILAPSNANGTAAARFRTLNVAGTVGIPSWALTATVDAVNNSWLFDPTTVHGWWTAPQRLQFPGSDPGAATAPNAYAPVAYIDLAIWGYKAFANSDIAGVRQVTYDDGES